MSDYFFTCVFFIRLAYGNRSVCFPKIHIFIRKKYFKILSAKQCQVQIHLLLSSLKIRGVFLIFQIMVKYFGKSDAPECTCIMRTCAHVCLKWVYVSVVSSCPCVEEVILIHGKRKKRTCSNNTSSPLQDPKSGFPIRIGLLTG